MPIIINFARVSFPISKIWPRGHGGGNKGGDGIYG